MKYDALSIIGIILSIIAIAGVCYNCVIIPEVNDDLVTWETIPQYDDAISTLQQDVANMKLGITNLNFRYDSNELSNIKQVLDNLDDDLNDDVDKLYHDIDKIEDCLEDESNYTAFKECVD